MIVSRWINRYLRFLDNNFHQQKGIGSEIREQWNLNCPGLSLAEGADWAGWRFSVRSGAASELPEAAAIRAEAPRGHPVGVGSEAALEWARYAQEPAEGGALAVSPRSTAELAC